MKKGSAHSDETKAKMRLRAQDRKPETRYSPLSEEEKKIRKTARDAGENWYFFPRPCKHGHIEKKTTDASQCYRCHYLDSSSREKRRTRSEPWRIAFYSAKQRAGKIGVKFSLTQQELKSIWPVTGTCPILGIPMFSGHKTHDGSPTLDRTHPAGDYVITNVVFISQLANRIKQNITDPRIFDRLAAWMTNPSFVPSISTHVCEKPKSICVCYRLWKERQKEAEREGIPFDLELEYVQRLLSVPGCPIMLTPFIRSKKRGPCATSPTLDKRQPNLGYVKGNVAVISHLANRIKNNVSDPNYFLLMAVWLRELGF